MFDGAFRSTLSAVLLVATLGSPALAQDADVKAAWTALRSFARDSGLTIAVRGVTDFGTSMVAEGVRIYPEDDPQALLVEMDELRIEGRGGSRIALIPSAEMTVTLRDGAERIFALHPDGEVSYEITEDVIDFDLAFASLAIDLVQSTRRGVPTGEALNLALTALDGAFHAEREGSAEVSLNADQVGYTFAFEQASGLTPTRQRGEATIEGLRLELAGTELDMLSDEPGALARAFDAGFMARLVLSTGATTGESWQAYGPQEILVRSQSDGSELRIEAVDGAFAATTHAGAGSMEGGMGPMQGALTLDGADLSLGFPLVATAEDQPVYYRMALNNVVPSTETLALFNAQSFAGQGVSLALDIAADGRLVDQLGPDFGAGDAPPFDVSNLRLEQLDLRVGPAQLTGTGAFVFIGGLLASVDADFPNGTGDFTFDLLGGDALLTGLSAAGLIPQDQQFFARMMMNGLGRPVGEDHLRSEVAIRPDGAVTVNGAPLPF